MNTINRPNDIVSGNNDLELLSSFKDFPVFMGCVEQDRSEDLVSDMNVYISRSTGMLQLNPVLPLDVVYQTEHNPGTTGQGWLNHHHALAKFINEFNPQTVYEIGGAHGILSEHCYGYNSDINWTIIEPNPVPVPGLRAKMIKGFYTEDTELPEHIDMLVHSHVLEHVYDPDSFLRALSKLPKGTKMCFSVPALEYHLEQKFTNTLNFEHTYFCTEEYIEWWLESWGFKLLAKSYYGEDHSIFYATQRTDMDHTDIPKPNAYSRNLNLWREYLKYHLRLIEDINARIEKEENVYLFGAHIFSQFLLGFGLDRSRIKYILDNSELKQGKRLYGTDLMVHSPKELKGVDNPVIILRSGVFNKEIKKDILENINPTAVFLE